MAYVKYKKVLLFFIIITMLQNNFNSNEIIIIIIIIIIITIIMIIRISAYVVGLFHTVMQPTFLYLYYCFFPGGPQMLNYSRGTDLLS